MRENRFYVKLEKCEFAQEEITFLGHKINAGLIRMDKGKMQAIMEWSVSTKVTELQSFLGLANYYRRFIKGYSKREAISIEPVLRLPDLDLLFEVQTDASDRALGGVLVQEGHPMAFESRKLNNAEQRYSTHEKEMMAVKKLSPRQARWQEFLADFKFKWLHRPGRHNTVADALSRKEVEAVSKGEGDQEMDKTERKKAVGLLHPSHSRETLGEHFHGFYHWIPKDGEDQCLTGGIPQALCDSNTKELGGLNGYCSVVLQLVEKLNNRDESL
ncbi:Retrovirus-related Pol polyprotein from transposon 297 [Vitis vinifera]|uniref:Retrovirus-related Pol polyprotein from transposon 297 n=1 Tax=Vitis vinifera TaxID=29760 RepID=A0A438CBH5_VITVI|nr:Retrovirus-related Pol polyprotein from transposon 297 [Vitis vinifera]